MASTNSPGSSPEDILKRIEGHKVFSFSYFQYYTFGSIDIGLFQKLSHVDDIYFFNFAYSNQILDSLGMT